MVKHRRRRTPEDSRARVFHAAAQEFAARGYAGANMDRIARAARLNKAMIYYYYGSKAALYRDILQDMFGAVDARVRAVVASAAPPAEKLRAFVAAIAAEAERRPHFPPIWFREIAEGGEHVDAANLRHAQGVLQSLAAIVEEGCASGVFRSTDPLLLHGGIIAPLMFFLVTERFRQKLQRAGLHGAATLPRDTVIAQIQRIALGVLEGRLT